MTGIREILQSHEAPDRPICSLASNDDQRAKWDFWGSRLSDRAILGINQHVNEGGWWSTARQDIAITF